MWASPMWISFLTVAFSLCNRGVFGVSFVCGSLSNEKIRAIAEQRSNEKTMGEAGRKEKGSELFSLPFPPRPLPHPLLV